MLHNSINYDLPEQLIPLAGAVPANKAGPRVRALPHQVHA